jgi:hypothetical protein
MYKVEKVKKVAIKHRGISHSLVNQNSIIRQGDLQHTAPLTVLTCGFLLHTVHTAGQMLRVFYRGIMPMGIPILPNSESLLHSGER